MIKDTRVLSFMLMHILFIGLAGRQEYILFIYSLIKPNMKT